MHKLYVLLAGLCIATGTIGQVDTAQKTTQYPDTLHVGGLSIIRYGKGNQDSSYKMKPYVRHQKHGNSQNVSTNWGIVDLGFANWTDKTNYASAGAQQIAPGSNSNTFNLRYGKSVNVNIWFFMQRLNVIAHVVNLKYGLGLELNNYRYDKNILWNKTTDQFNMDLTHNYHKNKLAADYFTVPMMLDFNFTPHNSSKSSFGFSAGMSAGYLYSSRQKVITSEDGKQKTHDNFELNPFKLSYIAELKLGPVKLYGSMATKNMFKDGLDQTPYTFGLRLSNW